MEQYAGIDVSLEYSSICIVDARGKVLKEAHAASEPEALIAWFAAQEVAWHGSGWKRVRSRNGSLPR